MPANPYEWDGISSTIPDYLIEPDTGSQNPWQVSTEPGGSFTVTITADPSAGDTNVLPWFQTDPEGNRSTMPDPCGEPGATNVACPLLNMFMSPPQEDQAGIFSNVDNRYMMTLFDPDKVYVMRGKLPRTPDGTHPVPWPSDDYDLRYFSVCDIIYVRPYPAVADDGCAVDYQIPIDGDRMYTIVYSTEANRPTNATADNGVAWIKAEAVVRNFLVMRHMLPNEDFAQAAQNVPQDAAWTSAFTVMGDYYPTTTVECNTAAFEISPAKCFVPPPPGEPNPFLFGSTVVA